MKKNGTICVSKIEQEIGRVITKVYGKIVPSVRVNGWSIDIYVPSIDTYVQVDGTYWHGLDRPISIIESSSKKIDKIISRKYYRDIEQNMWFKSQNMKLVRLIDTEWKNAKNKIEFLEQKLKDSDDK